MLDDVVCSESDNIVLRFGTMTLVEGGTLVESCSGTGVAKLTVDRVSDDGIEPSCECIETECLLSMKFEKSENIALAWTGFEVVGTTASFLAVVIMV